MAVLMTRRQMPMIAVLAFIDGKFRRVMIILGNFRSEFGFFLGAVANLMRITYPATLGFIFKIRVQMFVSISHILLL